MSVRDDLCGLLLLFMLTNDVMNWQAREASKELGRQVEEVEQDAERTLRSTMRRAQESAERVQEPIEKAVNASIDAAAAIGDEVFKLGDSIIEAVEEATGMAGPGRSYTRSERRERNYEDKKSDEDLVGGKYKPAGKSVVKRYQGVREDGDDSQEEDGSFSGLTVLVAGATGATGRCATYWHSISGMAPSFICFALKTYSERLHGYFLLQELEGVI